MRKLATVVVTCAVTVLGACLPKDDTGGRGGPAPSTAPKGSVDVVVAASPEKLTLLQGLAEQFNKRHEKAGGKPVWVSIQKTSSGIGADLLVDDWRGAEQGQRKPTVWSPSASLWGQLVNERRLRAGKKAVVGDFQPIMLTPAVIAMPKPMAEALGWPSTPIGWADIVSIAQDPAGWGKFGHPEWGPFRLGKTDPNISTTGFNSTIAQAYAGVGKQRDLTAEDVKSPQEVAFLEGVESAIVHYGDTTLTFLNNLYKADKRGAALGYVSAVAVEEKSVIDYNSGNPDGILDPGEKAKKPRVPLVAVYPKEGTLWSDNPYYVLEASWVSKTQREGAEKFRDWVVGRRQSQEKVLEFGFRPSDPDIALGAPIDAANGLDPKQPQTVLPVPPGNVLLDVLSAWNNTRKAARILLVLDVSGSMGDQAGSGDETKLDLAKEAVIDGLDHFNERDEVGLWVFSTNLAGQDDFKEALPIEPIATNRDKLKTYVGALVPQGGTGLYDTTQAAVQYMEPKASLDRITAIVLLTDGRNEDDTNNDLDALVKKIGRQGELRKVRVFAIAYGQDASVTELTRIAEATQGALYKSQDPKDIQRVFRNVVSNF